MKDKCICTTFKLSVAAVAGVALAGVAIAEGQQTRQTGNPFGNKSPALEQRAQMKRAKSAARLEHAKMVAAHEAANNSKFGGIAGSGTCPNPLNDCCIANPATNGGGCSDTVCCSTVCACDPFCCSVQWDLYCAGTGSVAGCGAQLLCGCKVVLPCPNPEHDCCSTGTPGCSDTACCSTVCAADSFCCNFAWDVICVGEAISLCGIACTFCPELTDHDCYSTGSPGCTDTVCCEAVCAVDPFCCQVFWDGICVNEAFMICVLSRHAICPDNAIIEPEPCGENTNDGCNSVGACAPSGTCCNASFGLGCSDDACEAAVCSFDPFCCTSAWDSSCAAEAAGDPNCDCTPTPCDPFVHIECGDIVCGTEWSSPALRDTDWYKFCIGYCGTNVNWSVTTAMPTYTAILNDDCGALVILAQGSGFLPLRANAILLPGGYIAFVAPSVFADLPCGSKNNVYVAVLTCETPRIDATCAGDIAGAGGPPDFNLPNGTVDTDDLLKVINNWGDCDIVPGCE